MCSFILASFFSSCVLISSSSFFLASSKLFVSFSSLLSSFGSSSLIIFSICLCSAIYAPDTIWLSCWADSIVSLLDSEAVAIFGSVVFSTKLSLKRTVRYLLEDTTLLLYCQHFDKYFINVII